MASFGYCPLQTENSKEVFMPFVRQAMGKCPPNLPWGAASREGSCFASCDYMASTLARHFYDDLGKYVGPKKQVYLTAQEMLEFVDWSEMPAAGEEWWIRPTVERSMPIAKATQRFVTLLKKVDERTPIDEFPCDNLGRHEFALAFAKSVFSFAAIEESVDLTAIAEDAERRFQAPQDKFSMFTVDSICKHSQQALCNLVQGGAYKTLGLSKKKPATLETIKDAIVGILSSENVPAYVPKTLYPVFCLRVASLSKSPRFRTVSGSRQLSQALLTFTKSRNTWRRSEGCPEKFSEAMEWAMAAVDAEEADSMKESMGLEMFWCETMETQTMILNYLISDLTRRNTAFLIAMENKNVQEFMPALHVSSQWLDLVAGLIPKISTGKVIRTLNHLSQAEVLGRTRLLSRVIQGIVECPKVRPFRATAELHLYHVRRLEAQVAAISSIIKSTVRTVINLTLERVKKGIENSHGALQVDVENLSTLRHPSLHSCVDRVRAALACGFLTNPKHERAERYKMVRREIKDRALVGMALCPEDGDMQYRMDDDGADDGPKDLDGCCARRRQLCELMGMPDEAHRRGLFSSAEAPSHEGTHPLYEGLGAPEVSCEDCPEILDCKKLDSPPNETWFADYEEAIQPLQQVLLSTRGIYRENMATGVVLPEAPELTAAQPWVRSTTKDSLAVLSLSQMLATISRWASGSRVLAALEKWIPPAWALRTAAESDAMLLKLTGSVEVKVERISELYLMTEPMPKWATVILFQEPKLGVDFGHADKVTIRGPVAGIAISMSKDTILSTFDKILDIEDKGGKPFSLLVQHMLKVLDTMRGISRTRGEQFKYDHSRAVAKNDEVLSGLLAACDPDKDLASDWSILLTNLYRMCSEEKAAGTHRRHVFREIKRIETACRDKFEDWSRERRSAADGKSKRRLAILKTLPPTVVSREIGKAKAKILSKMKRREHLSRMEARFLVRCKEAKKTRVMTDELLGLCASVLSY